VVREMMEISLIANVVLQHSAVAVVLLALGSMLLPRRRGGLMVAVDTLAWLVIAAGSVVGLATIWEFVQLLQGGNLFEKAAFANRAGGDYAWFHWLRAFSVVVAPQLLWWRRCRASAWGALMTGLVISAPFVLAMLPPQLR